MLRVGGLGASRTIQVGGIGALTLVAALIIVADTASRAASDVSLASAMPTVKLLNGLEVPMVAYGLADPLCFTPCNAFSFGDFNKGLANETWIRASGCGTAAYAGVQELSTFDSVVEAYKIGFRAFDTAQNYCSQPALGDALRSLGVPRESFFISTKVPPSNADTEDGARALEGALAQSLRQLEFDYVDLIMLHETDTAGTCEANQAAWTILEDFYLAGKAKAMCVLANSPCRPRASPPSARLSAEIAAHLHYTSMPNSHATSALTPSLPLSLSHARAAASPTGAWPCSSACSRRRASSR